MSTLAPNASLSSFLPMILQDKRTAVLKHMAQSERLVSVRPASRLEVRPKPEMLSIGIAELDALIGGIPRGCLAEICGAPSSGKTSVLLATIAAATRREEACVLIDASDSFDPSSGEAAGLNFNKLLWVRCGKSSSVPSTGSTCSGQAENGRSLANPSNSVFPNRANDQRLTTNDFRRPRKSNENRLEQVLKSTDLILQSGGFGLVALDLAGIPAKFVRRIPLASWFRFQRAVEHTKTALLVISEFPCAQTCAALVMKLSAVSCEPLAKSTVHNPTHKSKLDLVHHAEPIYSSSRKAAAGESPAWKRRVEEEVNIESRKGRHWICEANENGSNDRKLAPEGRTNLAQRFSAGEATKSSSSPVGTAKFSFSHLPSEKPLHAQVLEEIQIEAEILRSRLVHNEDRKPIQSVRTRFSTQAVRAG
jgi:recombination protein RecA